MSLFTKGPFTRAKNVHVVLPKAALETIFDECDHYDQDETGGRILGTYEQRGGKLFITVSGIIEPGPRARRTATSFFQDGEYQETVFREIEEREASIEHLGNWHTHHVNGYPNLSGGDIETYRRIVEHENHNTDFFYALLVVAKHHGKESLARYAFKNYVFRRGDSRIYEIDRRAIKVVDAPIIWPRSSRSDTPAAVRKPSRAEIGRVYDRDMLREFFPRMAPYMSKELGVYWRGPIELIDGSSIETVVMEDASAQHMSYTVAVRKPSPALARVAEEVGRETFPSARVALIEAERACNRALYEEMQQATTK